MKRHKLLRARRKRGRCPCQGSSHSDCEVTRAIRQAVSRADDKRDYERDLAEFEKEMQDTYLGEPV